jgi:septation ring formation regulator EzrA
MSDRPTPETEQVKAAMHANWNDLLNHARKLERERDEAREELYDIRINLGDDAEGYTLLHAVCVMQNERDDVMEKYATEATEHMLAINKLCNERDEAREEAHRFRSLHYSHLGINGSASWFPWEAK